MDKRRKWLLPVLMVVCGMQLMIIIFISFKEPSVSIESDGSDDWLSEVQSESCEESIVESEPIFWVVDVKGAVVNPGVYEVAKNMRVQDAVDLAGGLLPDAETRHLNFAQRLTDQMLIYIPAKGEELDEKSVDSLITETGDTENIGKININTADANELQTLPGIGEKKAQQIIDHRQQNGSFSSIEAIMDVNGIGQKTFETLREFITVKK